jgi:hypothetical protein
MSGFYISLPPFDLKWLQDQWPGYILPSLNTKDLVIHGLKSIQGARDAGCWWYTLISGCFGELKMVGSSSDHDIFTWLIHNETVFIGLATDDILVCL